MHSYNNLFCKLIDYDNLKCAAINAAKGKAHKSSVKRAMRDLDRTVRSLQKKLIDGTWRPRKLHIGHHIKDGLSGKDRVIVCPDFVGEQIIHHAVIQIISPLVIGTFFRWSCGSIPGRGQESMIHHLEKVIRSHPKKCKYCVKLDVAKFFDTISTLSILKTCKRFIRDRKFLLILAHLLRGNRILQPNGSVKHAGIPIGFYTSPWFANISLNKIDHIIKDKFGVFLYARFMDDMILFDPNRRKLKQVVSTIEEELKKFKLKYKYQPQIHRFNCESRKVQFTGYVLTPTRIKLRDRVFLRASRAATRIHKQVFIKLKQKLNAFFASRIVAYVGRFRNANAGKALKHHLLKDGMLNLGVLHGLIANRARAQNAHKKRILSKKNKRHRELHPSQGTPCKTVYVLHGEPVDNWVDDEVY